MTGGGPTRSTVDNATSVDTADVGGRRERQRELLETVGRLAGGIAHDFNNLLSTIVGYSELLEIQLQKRNDSRLERNDLSEIQSAAARAAELTQRLLAFAERLPSRPVELTPHALIKGIERILVRLAPPGVQFVVNLPAEEAFIQVDRSQMERAITYLVVNGFDAMSGGGVLTLQVEWRDLVRDGLPPGVIVGRDANVNGAYADISVIDDGRGMTASEIDAAFQPYVTSKDTQEMGGGLGLPAVFGLVSKAGGVLVVDSRTHGTTTNSARAGTTVHVLIPRLTDTTSHTQP